MRTIKKSVCLIAALAMLSLTVQNCNMSSGGGNYDKELGQLANELNKTCPTMVDKDTRLDNAAAVPHNVFIYSYTLVNYDKTQVDTNQLKTYIRPKVVENIKTNPDMKTFRDNKITLMYEYKDKNGTFLFKVAATPADYAQ